MGRIVLPGNTTIVDWRKHMKARSEDVVIEGGPEGPGRRMGMRWHMDRESYQRVMDMQACYNCLTAFPARPMASNLAIWKQSGFNHVRPAAVAHRLIREERCPVCSVHIGPEALGLHDEGENPLNSRDD